MAGHPGRVRRPGAPGPRPPGTPPGATRPPAADAARRTGGPPREAHGRARKLLGGGAGPVLGADRAGPGGRHPPPGPHGRRTRRGPSPRRPPRLAELGERRAADGPPQASAGPGDGGRRTAPHPLGLHRTGPAHPHHAAGPAADRLSGARHRHAVAAAAHGRGRGPHRRARPLAHPAPDRAGVPGLHHAAGPPHRALPGRGLPAAHRSARRGPGQRPPRRPLRPLRPHHRGRDPSPRRVPLHGGPRKPSGARRRYGSRYPMPRTVSSRSAPSFRRSART
ncbi:hypothetical protein SCALM49S_05041 [Streptomyces californicus]